MNFFTKACRTPLLFAAVAVGIVCMSGCSGSGGGTGPSGYAVTVTSAGTDATGGGNYAPGATVYINAGTPPAGQKFKSWTSTNNGVTFANPNSAATTFTMPDNTVAVTAVFETVAVNPVTHKVTVTSAGTGASSGGDYAPGATVNIDAGAPPAGQRFKRWTTASSGVTFVKPDSAATSFTMPANAVAVTANFEAEIAVPVTNAVTVTSAGTGATGDGSYAAGDTVSIYAGTPPAGQRFKNWESSSGVVFAKGDSAATGFVMPASAVTVTANFEAATVGPVTYKVTVVSAGTGATGDGDYASGATVSINAGTLPTGSGMRRFKKWTSSVNNVFFADAKNVATMFNMPASDVTVTAEFERVYTIFLSSAGTGATGGGNYAAGDTVSIYAGTPPEGQRFKNWTGGTGTSTTITFANENSAATTFIMPGLDAIVINANFEPTNIYEVEVKSAGTGVTGSGSYSVGVTVTVKAGTPPDGMVFDYWGCNYMGILGDDKYKATASFTMPAGNLTFTAYFKVSSSSGEFTDTRNGKKYKTTTIGSQTWMAENLDYTYSINKQPPLVHYDKCYGGTDGEANCDLYGRLYDWNEAKTACPSGWHLPTREEWGTLAKAAGASGEYGNMGDIGVKLRAASWANGKDDFGFSALPGGYGNFNNEGDIEFAGIDGVAAWWTATEGESGTAYMRGLNTISPAVSLYEANDAKEDWNSVRCVRD